MKKLLILCAVMACSIAAGAQTVIDNFTVGPYEVDYNGQGDVKYRLRDNINLYEYFELQRDTTIVAPVTVTPLGRGIQISGYVGANRFSSKEIGLEGVWKQNIATNLYFNGGLSFTIGYTNLYHSFIRNMFEIGVPLQIELGKMSHQKAGLYGIFGLAPTYYTTMSVKNWASADNKFVEANDDLKKSGFLIAPTLEFGGNIPVGSVILRIGVYGKYKINCTTGTMDVYKDTAGRFFAGAKIGVIF